MNKVSSWVKKVNQSYLYQDQNIWEEPDCVEL